jgi:NADPH-dependent curcumin reductase CurA
MHTDRQWIFNRRPAHDIEPDTLVLRDVQLPPLQEGQFRLRTIYLSLDATNRIWLSDWDSYMDPIRIGDPMLGFAVGEVMESRNAAFPVGTLAAGLQPWATQVVTDGTGFTAMPRVAGLPIDEAFGILAIAGPSACIGLLDVGRPKRGDTVLVTAAAGAVGMVVGQVARIHGCRTIGVAGGAEKCRWLRDEVGYDHVIDYKAGDLVAELRKAAPDGVDLLFENVGGEILDAGLTVMKNFGTVVVCGLISSYNAGGSPVPGPYMFRNVIMRRLRIEGFVVLDHLDKIPAYQQQLAGWMLAGKLKYRIHVVDGIENAQDALRLLYTGGNHGKLMVRIGHDPG